MEPISKPKTIAEPDALKIAIAVAFAVVRTKRLGQHSAVPSSSLADAEIHRWKRKAEERKRDVISLREEINRLEEGREPNSDPVPQIISCRCRFFDGCGLSGARAKGIGKGDDDDWIDDALRRRFLRHVLWKEKQRRLQGSMRKRHCVDLGDSNEMDWLCTAIDFLLELCSNKLSEIGNCNYASLSHQATNSIIEIAKKVFVVRSLPLFLLEVSLKKLPKKEDAIIEDVISRLLTSLLQRMWSIMGKNGTCGSSIITDIHIQHLIRKLGEEPFIGQRALILVSQKISCLADSLLITDPFDDAFPDIHDYMYMMIQLTEFIIQDNLQLWMKNGDLGNNQFDEWVRSILQARQVLEALEHRSGSYLIYLERVIGVTAKQAGQHSHLLTTLLCS